MSKRHQAAVTLILTPDDLRIMTTALDRVDIRGRSDTVAEERELIGKAVIHLYSAGMTDLDLLTDAARIMAAAHKLGRSVERGVA